MNRLIHSLCAVLPRRPLHIAATLRRVAAARGAMLVLFVTCIASSAYARSAAPERHQFTEPIVDIDRIGNIDGTVAGARKVLQDTVWIADWTFDTAAPCDFSGWTKVDNHVMNDGSVFWDLDATFGGTGGIVGTAAALGYENDLCCEDLNGYDNDWYQAIRIEYAGGGAADVSFDFIVDSEGGFDFLHVETDSACASADRVDFDLDPSRDAASFRTVLFSISGFLEAGNVSGLALEDYGAGTHCVYIAFFADGGFSPCDGLQPTETGKAIVIDNIVVHDPSGTRSEDFEDQSLDIGTFVNIANSAPFGPTGPGRDGSWARTFLHVTDNDACTENTSCAVLWTDDTTPTIANDPSMAFGPAAFVVKNWLDDIIVSPWVSLASTPNATNTIVRFRRFPGNFFSTSRLVQNWSIRARVDVEDGMGGTISCISGWGHSFQWNSLSFFGWITPGSPGNGYDASADFDPTASEIQVRHRTSDWQWIVGAPPPIDFMPGPGPYIDRTRIGRIIRTGPVLDEGIDARSQGQDAFPTEPNPAGTGPQPYYRPTTDRFGTVAFSRGTELGINNSSPHLITGDSVCVKVEDVRGAGGIVAIDVYGIIADGPHAGLAPPPHAVGSNGFFVVAGDTTRASNGTPVHDFFFVDFDDEYFVGGDVLQYFWLAQDALGGFGSLPTGLSGAPASLDEAQAATDGLFEVNFLPAIDWNATFLAAVGANNKVDPKSDPAFLDGSTQRNCVLYVNRINSRRRSGDVNRTSFMYTLDRLGYRGEYDVYDHTGMGNTNNHLGGRATIQQAQGYALIVYDAGDTGPGGTIMPDGGGLDAEKIDQAGWFRDWLAQASVSEVGHATLWVIGSNVLHEKPTNALYNVDMQATLAGTGQAVAINPDCVGEATFSFDVGGTSNAVDFTVGARARYSLQGGCPVPRHYDALAATGTGVEVYRYVDPSSATQGDAAVVMNASAAGNWNTVLQSHPWFDIREPDVASPEPQEDLLATMLQSVLPAGCATGSGTVGTGPAPDVAFRPRARTTLHRNVPNPFNPTTTIRFDLAHDGHVTLRIYDVAGRWVRTLLEGRRRAATGIAHVWDGRDARGEPVSTGVYFYRLETEHVMQTRKMLLVQ